MITASETGGGVTADKVGEGGRAPGLAGEREAALRVQPVAVYEGEDGEELSQGGGHGSDDLPDQSEEGERDGHDPH